MGETDSPAMSGILVVPLSITPPLEHKKACVTQVPDLELLIISVRAGAEVAHWLCVIPVRDAVAINAIVPIVAIGDVNAAAHALGCVDCEAPVSVWLAGACARATGCCRGSGCGRGGSARGSGARGIGFRFLGVEITREGGLVIVTFDVWRWVGFFLNRIGFESVSLILGSGIHQNETGACECEGKRVVGGGYGEIVAGRGGVGDDPIENGLSPRGGLSVGLFRRAGPGLRVRCAIRGNGREKGGEGPGAGREGAFGHRCIGWGGSV